MCVEKVCVCVYYCRTWYKSVCVLWGRGDLGVFIMQEKGARLLGKRTLCCKDPELIVVNYNIHLF